MGVTFVALCSEEEPDPRPRVVLPDESAYSASVSDGKGTVSVDPATVGVLEPVTLTFTYRAEREGIAVGGGVVCMVSRFWAWTPPQDVAPNSPGYTTVRCSDLRVGLETYMDRSSGSIVSAVRGHPLRAGQTITVVYGDTGDGAHPGARGVSDRYSERKERFFFKVDGDGDGFFTPVAAQPYIRVEAREAYRLVLLGPARVHHNEPFELRLSVVDRGDNLVESFEGDVLLACAGAEAELPERVSLAASDRGSRGVEVVPRSGTLMQCAASDPGGALVEGRSNPILVSGDEDERYRLYWADLHGHSNYSDGTGEPEEWFRYARDVARLDVVALTDHDHWGYVLLDEDEAAWRYLLGTAAKFNEPGRFVTLPGYEWTNWTFGHKHVLFAKESEASMLSSFDGRTDEPNELWAALGERDCVTISHHPGGGPIPTFWKYHNPRYEPVAEITSVHGVSENMAHPKRIYSPVESGMVQSALARGYRLGIIGSGDTHDGHPGMRALGAGVSGLAGVYATELTREAILEALRARRVYATTGCRAVLRFHMGDHPMGSVGRLNSADVERRFNVSILGDAPIRRVTMVKNNSDVAVREFDSMLATWEWADPDPARDGDIYYARVEQADQEWVWSSPIWIELSTDKQRQSPAAGVSPHR